MELLAGCSAASSCYCRGARGLRSRCPALPSLPARGRDRPQAHGLPHRHSGHWGRAALLHCDQDFEVIAHHSPLRVAGCQLGLCAATIAAAASLTGVIAHIPEARDEIQRFAEHLARLAGHIRAAPRSPAALLGLVVAVADATPCSPSTATIPLAHRADHAGCHQSTPAARSKASRISTRSARRLPERSAILPVSPTSRTRWVSAPIPPEPASPPDPTTDFDDPFAPWRTRPQDWTTRCR
jgi:hypothetical protein